MKKYVVSLAILMSLLFASNIMAQKPGKSGAEFLKLPIGARQAGLGGAFVGIGDDVNSLFWNPGGLATLKTWAFSAMHNEWFADLRFDAFGFSSPIFGRKNVVGVMAGILSMPSWDNTAGREPKVSAQDMYAGIAFARNVYSGFYIGGAAKYIRRELASYDAVALAYDFGAIYKRSNWLTLGGSFQNYGDKIKFIQHKASLPFVLRAGGSLRPFYGKTFDLILAVDGFYYMNEDIRQFSVGSEVSLFNFFDLRAGYRLDKTILSLSTGMGIRYGIFQLDYAYNPFEDELSGFSHVFSTHQISLTIRSISPIPFTSYYPGPNKKTYLKKNTLLNKLKRDLLREQKQRKLAKLNEQQREVEKFFEGNSKMTFYLDPDTSSLQFKWEKSIDPDPGDEVNYKILYTRINFARNENLAERLKKVAAGSELCNSKEPLGWSRFNLQSDDDTVRCVIAPLRNEEGQLILETGQYAWWIEAFDQDSHTRSIEDNLRLFEVNYIKPPILEEPENRIKIKPKWKKEGDSSGIEKNDEDLPQEIPGGGLKNRLQSEQQWITSEPVTFKWKPAILGFGNQNVRVKVYDEADTLSPLIDINVTKPYNNTLQTNLSNGRGGAVKYQCLSDSSVKIDIPILALHKDFYWEVEAVNYEFRRDKVSTKWMFSLEIDKMMPPKQWYPLSGDPGVDIPVIAKFNSDTLFTKRITVSNTDIPMIPIFFFDSGSDLLDNDSQNHLDTLKTTLSNLANANPDVKVIIIGYCDRESDGGETKAALQLATRRAEKIREILLTNNPEIEMQLIISIPEGNDVFKTRIAKTPETNLDRKKIQAENRRVELKTKISESEKLENITSFEQLYQDRDKILFIKRVLSDNENVILILKGHDLDELYDYKNRLQKKMGFKNKIYTISSNSNHTDFEVKLSGDKIIYRPVSPTPLLEQYESSKLNVNIESVAAPSSFEWELELRTDLNSPGIKLQDGSVSSNYTSASWTVNYQDDRAIRIAKAINQPSILLLTITPHLGKIPSQFAKPVIIRHTDFQIVKERKIIIQYYFDSVVAESEFLETQIEDFATKLMEINPQDVKKIIITGHTCNIGNAKRNIILSNQRSDKVFDLLIDRLNLNVRKKINDKKAAAWIDLLKGHSLGTSFWFPYGSKMEFGTQEAITKVNAIEVEPQNLTPRMRSMNRRTQVDIIRHEK